MKNKTLVHIVFIIFFASGCSYVGKKEFTQMENRVKKLELIIWAMNPMILHCPVDWWDVVKPRKLANLKTGLGSIGKDITLPEGVNFSKMKEYKSGIDGATEKCMVPGTFFYIPTFHKFERTAHCGFFEF